MLTIEEKKYDRDAVDVRPAVALDGGVPLIVSNAPILLKCKMWGL